MDWQDSLRQFLDNNPDLPEGGAPAETPEETAAAKPAKLRKVTVVFERKGRAGKSATIVCDFPPSVSDDEIEQLASTLRRRLGTGGSCRAREILIQGDRREALAKLLPTLGYKSNG